MKDRCGQNKINQVFSTTWCENIFRRWIVRLQTFFRSVRR